MREWRNRVRHVLVRPDLLIGRMQLRRHELRRLLLGWPMHGLQRPALRRKRRCLRALRSEPKVQRPGDVHLRRDLMPERMLRQYRRLPDFQYYHLRCRRRRMQGLLERAGVQRVRCLCLQRRLVPERLLLRERDLRALRERTGEWRLRERGGDVQGVPLG